MKKTEEVFFTLLCKGIGTINNKSIPLLKENEWEEVFCLSKRQTLTGIILEGIKTLEADKTPSKKILLRWFTNVERIKEKNKELNLTAIKVSERFKKDGFHSVILKGQGVALYYPDPTLRIPGDIDIWLDGSREDIINYVRKYCPKVGARYHHIDFPVLKNVDIEVHFTPTWMNSFKGNKILQKQFEIWKKDAFQNNVQLPYCDGNICVPTDEMNRIYLLIHIYHHFFDEGIGLRQLIDYFYLLKKGCTAEERQRFQSFIETLKIQKFTKALMYVLHQVMGLEKEYLLTDINEKAGKFLLEEILRSGNFGHTDERIKRDKGKSTEYYWSKFIHKIHFFSAYPRDIFNNIIFWFWQYQWRKKNGYL